ncbi:MAG: contractile injection system protein, VgrG/Pvc8 family, partial [Novosphingobium sp.]|nr:contractile injection system protein, VgrG/Pvc8 family [Novosphingobium sp.]
MAGWQVTLDGEDLTDAMRPRLVELKLTEKREGGADELNITLHDYDSKMAIPAEGAVLAVRFGWVRGPGVYIGLVDKGRFKVDEVEWGGLPDQLTIRARSADFTGNFRVRREIKRRDTTVGEVLTDIAGANGLKAMIAPELASIAIPVLAQDQRSDAAILKHLGRRHDAVATVKAGTLIFSPIGKGMNPEGQPLPGFTLTRAQCSKYRWCRAARDEYGGAEARWHDPDTAERKSEKAGGNGKGGSPKRLKRTFHRKEDAQHAARAEDKRIQRSAASF